MKNANVSNLVLICQKAYLKDALENLNDAFLMDFCGEDAFNTVYTTKAYLDLRVALHGSYVDPRKSFEQSLVNDGFINIVADEEFLFDYYLTDKGITFLKSLSNIEIIYN